jgi:hypothetical protein
MRRALLLGWRGLARLGSSSQGTHRSLSGAAQQGASNADAGDREFDEGLLPLLVCPLTKAPLRCAAG